MCVHELIECDFEIHAHESRPHDFVVIGKRIFEFPLPAWPTRLVPIARLNPHEGPEQNPTRGASERLSHVGEHPRRLPCSSWRPRCEMGEAIGNTMPEAKRQIASQTPATDSRFSNRQLVEKTEKCV